MKKQALTFFVFVVAWGSLALGADDPQLTITPLAEAELGTVTDAPLHFKLLRVTLPAGQTAQYEAAEGMVFQLSGAQTITTGDQTKTLQAGQGMHIGAGEPATFEAAAEEPAVFLHFLLTPASRLDETPDADAGTVTELYRTEQPLPGLQEGPYAFTLTQLNFPPNLPINKPHYRTGGALYYVLSGAGAFTTEDGTVAKPEGSVILEPYGLVHQWANPNDDPATVIVANITPKGASPFAFGTP